MAQIDPGQALTPKTAPRKEFNEFRESDGVLFNGSCYIKRTGLSLSSRGFSLEFQAKVSASAGTMEILEEVGENKLRVQVNPSSSQMKLYIDGETGTASGCSALQSKG